MMPPAHWLRIADIEGRVCVCYRTRPSDAFGPAHLSSPAELLQLLTVDGVAQVDARPKEQRSKVDAGWIWVNLTELIIKLSFWSKSYFM